MQDAMARHPGYRRSAISSYWVAAEPRFVAGRDRIIEHAAQLGLPP
jgi:hypothetical protein